MKYKKNSFLAFLYISYDVWYINVVKYKTFHVCYGEVIFSSSFYSKFKVNIYCINIIWCECCESTPATNTEKVSFSSTFFLFFYFSFFICRSNTAEHVIQNLYSKES